MKSFKTILFAFILFNCQSHAFGPFLSNRIYEPIPPAELPLSRANHLIDPVEGRAIVNRYQQGGQGAFYTSATLNSIIKQTNCSGIRGYYAYYQDRVTILINGSYRKTETKHNDQFNGLVALHTGKDVTSSDLNQQADSAKAYKACFDYRHSAHFNDKMKGGLFGKEAIEALLQQAGCIGVRFYLGLDKAGKKTMVLFGVDAKGNDLLAYVADQNVPCPNYCPDGNFLNTDNR
jgi:hypothetical protein